MSRVLRGVGAVLLVALWLWWPPAPAAAAICEGDPVPVPESAAAGVTGLLTPPIDPDRMGPPPVSDPDDLWRELGKIRPPERYLLAEYGIAGLSWHTITSSCLDKIRSQPVATMADLTWDLSRTVSLVTVVAYQAALTEDLASEFTSVVSDLVTTVRDGLWRPLLPSVVILGAVWMAWVGLVRRRVTLTLEGAAWMIGATTLAIWVLASPATFLILGAKIADTGVSWAHDLVARAGVDAAHECPPGAREVGPARHDAVPATEEGVERAAERLWAGYVCQPWLLGQFGAGSDADRAARDHGLALLNAQAVTRSESYHLASGHVSEEQLYESKAADYEDIAEALADEQPEVFATFEGARPTTRLGVAVAALVSAVAAGGLILLGAAAVIVLRMALVLLVLVAPVALLVGTHPATRTVALRWLETTLGLLIKHILLSIGLVVAALLHALVLAGSWPWGVQMLVLSLMSVAVLIYRKRLTRAFGQVSDAATAPVRVITQSTTSHSTGRGGLQRIRERHQERRHETHQRRQRTVERTPATGGPVAGDRRTTNDRAAGQTDRAAEQQDQRRTKRAPAASATPTPEPGPTPQRSTTPQQPTSRTDPGGTGRARDPRRAPALPDQANTNPPPAPTTDQLQPQPQRVRERGQTWGDVNQTGTDRTTGPPRRTDK